MKPKIFTVKVNIKFLDCAACCGGQIIGCYAPNGDHCERPLEIGMRYDNAFASIYDDTGEEIENAEMLFMDQGVYIYRAYSNGHPFDTSQVWIHFFEELLDKSEAVPSIILPYHMPNRHTWETVRRIVPTALTGVILTCDFDFSSEWKTYYDSRPETVRCGKDIILSKGFKSLKSPSGFQRQFSVHVNKDLGGLIFDDVMQGLMRDKDLSQLRFLGSCIAEYVSELIETGTEKEEIISNTFKYDHWRDKIKKKHGIEPMSKDAIVQRIGDLVRISVDDFISKQDLDEMFTKMRKQFFQLKRFEEKRKRQSERELSSDVAMEMANILKGKIKLVSIEKLQKNVQEEVMHWIFGNEDRVWRYRGGRDGYETIEQYLNFLPHIRNNNLENSKTENKNSPAFPGVVAVVESRNMFAPNIIQVKDIAAYAIGEYVEKFGEDSEDHTMKSVGAMPKYYEIVTAWVNPHFRKLNLSIRLYFEIFKSVQASYVAFEVLEGSFGRVLSSSPALDFLKRMLPLSIVMTTQEKSYHVETSTTEEQFERFAIRRRPVKFAVCMFETWRYLLKDFKFVVLAIFICILAIIICRFFI